MIMMMMMMIMIMIIIMINTNRVITLRTNFIISNIIVTTIEVIVYGDAYKEGTEEHLTNLSDGDDPCWEPLRDTVDVHKEVVEVHDGVDSVVHGAEIDAYS